MRPRKLKCRSRIFRTSVICFVFNLTFFLKFAISSCDSTNLSRSVSTPSHRDYYIYDDDVDIIKEDGTLISPDFYFEDDFSTSFEKTGAAGSFPNFNFNHHHVNRDESIKGETSSNNEFPVESEDHSIQNTEVEVAIHQITNNKSESGFREVNAPVITKRLDEEILVHHHRVLKSRFHDLIGSPPPTPISLQSRMQLNSPRPTNGLILNEFMHGNAISAVVVPHGNNKGPPSGPPPPPPPAPTLIIPKRVNGKPKVPGFDIFDYRKRQYGMHVFLYNFRHVIKYGAN